MKMIFSKLCLSKRKARELSLVVADLRHCSGTEKFQRAAFWSRKNFLVCPEATACRCPKLYRYRLLNARRTSWIGGGSTSLFWTLQQKWREKIAQANSRLSKKKYLKVISMNGLAPITQTYDSLNGRVYISSPKAFKMYRIGTVPIFFNPKIN